MDLAGGEVKIMFQLSDLHFVWCIAIGLLGVVYKLVLTRVEQSERHINKIFEKLEEQFKQHSTRHIELLTALHDGLSHKQDK